jgi:hypothetical protein
MSWQLTIASNGLWSELPLARRAAYGQHRLDGNPFLVGKFIAHDSAAFDQRLESRLGSGFNELWANGGLVAMRPKAGALCSA